MPLENLFWRKAPGGISDSVSSLCRLPNLPLILVDLRGSYDFVNMKVNPAGFAPDSGSAEPTSQVGSQ